MVQPFPLGWSVLLTVKNVGSPRHSKPIGESLTSAPQESLPLVSGAEAPQ